MHTRNLVVGITGGSGAIYAARFLKQAVRHYDRIFLIMSDQLDNCYRVPLSWPSSPGSNFRATELMQ